MAGTRDRKPTQPEVWRDVASELGGEYDEGGWTRGQRMRVPHHGWTLLVDPHAVSAGSVTVVYTRVRAPFLSRDDLKMSIYASGVFSKVGKAIGLQDIQVGRRSLDEKFVFKSNSVAKLRSTLMNDRVAGLLDSLGDVRVEVKRAERGLRKKLGDSARSVSVMTTGMLTDPERLRGLIELCGALLLELVRLGSAADEPVMIED